MKAFKSVFLLLSIFSAIASYAGGTLYLNGSQSILTDATEVLLGASLNLSQKLDRNFTYLGNFGYTVGESEEIRTTDISLFYTNQDIAYNFTKKFRVTTGFGVNYDDNRTKDDLRTKVKIGMSYTLW